MAANSRRYTVNEVIALLEQQDEFYDELRGDFDDESDDEEFPPESDFYNVDGTQLLIDSDMLLTASTQLLAQSVDYPDPAERDSLLLFDTDLNHDDSELGSESG